MNYTELYFKMKIILICGLLGIVIIGGTLLAIAYASKRLTEHITRQSECYECAYYQVGSECEEMCKECEINKWK